MDAIISAATGYANEHLRVFLESASRHCPDAPIFLIVYSKDRPRIERLRREYTMVQPIYIAKKYLRDLAPLRWLASRVCGGEYVNTQPWAAWLGRYALDIALERYFIALKLLKTRGASFANILLSDSRDVFFQANPFTLAEHGLISGLENRQIGQCQHNSRWIKDIYGEAALSEMSAHKIVCSGVTLGPTESVQAYLVQMCAEIWRHLPKISFYGGYDQGIHNRLIFERKINPTLVENAQGLIATLGYEEHQHFFADAQSGLLQVRQKYPVIVHQFNRRSLGLLDFVNGLFQAKSAEPH